MKSAALVFCALLFGSVTIAAQTAGQVQLSGTAGVEGLAPSQTAILQMTPTAAGCPVSLRARHGTAGNLREVDQNRPKGLAQLLHLTLVDPDSRQVVKDRLRVHGLSGKGRITQTLQNEDGSDVSQTLQVRFRPATGRTVSADLWAFGMTAVLSIDLSSVTFADGSTWSFSGQEACHVIPDPLMLVASR